MFDNFAIVFDTETTGLPNHDDTPLDQQPQITELCAIRINAKTCEEVGRINFLIKPNNPITEKMEEMIGITNEMVANEPPFKVRYKEIVDLFLGARYMVAQNVAFDRSLLRFELQRMDKLFQFPWPPVHCCTMLTHKKLNGGAGKNDMMTLHEHYVGEKFEGAHRAEVDTEALLRVVKAMQERELLWQN